MRYEFAIGLRYLRGKKRTRFISVITYIAIGGVAVGVMTMCVVLPVMSGFEQDLKTKILGTNSHALVIKHGIDFSEHEDIARKARSVAGVAGATPFILNEVMLASRGERSGAVIKGIDPATVDSVTDLKKNLRAGKLAHLDTPEDIPPPLWPSYGTHLEGPATASAHDRPVRPGIIVGIELAKMLRVEIGDDIHVISPLGDGSVGPMGPVPKARVFRVAAIFFSGFFEYDAKYVYIHYREAQKFFGLGDFVTGVELKFTNLDETGPIVDRVNAVLGGPPYRITDWRTMNKALFSALSLEKQVMFIILVFIVLVASFNIISTEYLFIAEKGREIAILKAMGAPNRDIMRIFQAIGLIIGGTGAVIGEALGFAVCMGVKHFKFQLDPEVYYIDSLPIELNAWEFAAVALAALVISYVATLPPAKLAARLVPVEGLRL